MFQSNLIEVFSWDDSVAPVGPNGSRPINDWIEVLTCAAWSAVTSRIFSAPDPWIPYLNGLAISDSL